MDNINISISGVAQNEFTIQNGDILNFEISGVAPFVLEVEGTPTVPTKLSQLQDDLGYRPTTDIEKEYWNNKQEALTNPITGTGSVGQLSIFTDVTEISSIPAITASIDPSTNRQYVTDDYLLGMVNAPNDITTSNPISDKKYTDDSISEIHFWNRDSEYIFPRYAGDSVNLLSGGIKDNNSSDVIFLDDTSNTYPVTYNKTLVGGINELKNLTAITKDPTGFEDSTDVNVAYDNITRRVTLTGNFKLYHRGVDVSLLDPTFVSGWVSPAHDNIVGYHYFLYYTGTSFEWTSNFQGFDHALICSIVYRSADKFCLRECHGCMPWQVHEELHKTIGTYRDSGGDFSSYVLSSTIATNRRPNISPCIICDEDSHTTNPALTSKLYARRFLSSTNTINYSLDSSEIIAVSGNNPYYNQYIGSLWRQTLMPANSVASVWILSVPAGNDNNSQKYRFIFEQPQWITQAQNSSATALAAARSAELSRQVSEVNLGETSLLALEFVTIARIVVQYTGGNWTIENVSYISGSKYAQSSASGNFLISVSANTTNLQGNGTPSNPLNTIQDIAQSSSPTFSGVSISGVTQLGMGAPFIKMKQLTGTTASTQGGSTTIAHGLTGSKILSVSAIVNNDINKGTLPNQTSTAGYQYDVNFDATNISVNNVTGNSSNIISKPFIITIFYTI